MPSPSESIAAYVSAVTDSFNAIDTALEGATTSAAGIAGDVAALKAEIDRIQNSPGTLSAVDQASLDAAQARVAALSGKMSAFTESLKALDEATEAPEPPAV